jgi:hypothetical protein
MQPAARAEHNTRGLRSLIEAYLSILRCFENLLRETDALATAGLIEE